MTELASLSGEDMQSRVHLVWRALTLTVALLASTSCTSSSDGPGNIGGGGSSTTAGAASSAAGATSVAGSGGTGVSTGGQIGAAGLSVAGSNTGGNLSSGGTPSGGRGGSMGATAGASSGGAGAPGAAGGSGSGAVALSAGCGKPAGLMNGRASIDVAGTMREYILALPADYDQSHPYRLIFGWHPWGGSAQQVASGGYYGLQTQAKGSAIFVAGEGLDFGGNGKGWGNENGQDIALLNAMLERFRAQLCIDENRIFSTGFSFGGMFSFAAGCSPTSMMRAIAPMAGNTSVAGCQSGTRPVAMMGFHGVDDTVVAIGGGRTGRDAFATRNKCTTQTMPTTPTWCDAAGQSYQPCACVTYQGCQDGYPVIWCEFKGPHTPAPNSGPTLWSFFSQF
jgi:polyhydroxybutyrate depolymerase